MIHVAVQHEPIDLAAELARSEVAGAGGVASFTGLVRVDDGVTGLELEHYPGMTEAALHTLAEEAVARWSLAAGAASGFVAAIVGLRALARLRRAQPTA